MVFLLKFKWLYKLRDPVFKSLRDLVHKDRPDFFKLEEIRLEEIISVLEVKGFFIENC